MELKVTQVPRGPGGGKPIALIPSKTWSNCYSGLTSVLYSHQWASSRPFAALLSLPGKDLRRRTPPPTPKHTLGAECGGGQCSPQTTVNPASFRCLTKWVHYQMFRVVRFPYSILHFPVLEDGPLNDEACALPTDSWVPTITKSCFILAENSAWTLGWEEPWNLMYWAPQFGTGRLTWRTWLLRRQEGETSKFADGERASAAPVGCYPPPDGEEKIDGFASLLPQTPSCCILAGRVLASSCGYTCVWVIREDKYTEKCNPFTLQGLVRRVTVSPGSSRELHVECKKKN